MSQGRASQQTPEAAPSDFSHRHRGPLYAPCHLAFLLQPPLGPPSPPSPSLLPFWGPIPKTFIGSLEAQWGSLILVSLPHSLAPVP